MLRSASSLVRRYLRGPEPVQKGGNAPKITDVPAKFNDPYCRHRQIVPFSWWLPSHKRPIFDDAFVAPSATLIGNVQVWPFASVWYNCVLKGDVSAIRIGSCTNIQDGTVIHEALQRLSPEHDGSTVIGHNVTVGHGCWLRGCTVEDFCLVGIGSVLEEGSYMEKHSILGAKSVLAKDSRIPSGELWMGNPAKFIRHVTEDEYLFFAQSADRYQLLAEVHQNQFGLPPHAYVDAREKGIEVGWRE